MYRQMKTEDDENKFSVGRFFKNFKDDQFSEVNLFSL